MSDKKKNKITWEDFKHLPWWTWLLLVDSTVKGIINVRGYIDKSSRGGAILSEQ